MLRPLTLWSLLSSALLVALSFVAAGTVHAAEENWPEFRGPHADGHADAHDLPTTWSESEHVRWKTPIHGKAWSSPVIWGDQIWLTSATPDGHQLSALRVDRESGKVTLDRQIFEIAEPQFCIPYNSYASSTPVIEAGRVYVHFGSAGTACLATATGDTVWARQDLPCDHFRGAASSPILYGDLLILTFDGADLQYTAALDKRTGGTVWRTDRKIDYGVPDSDGDHKKAYVTPLVIDVDGRKQLVSPSAGATIAYDPADGKELWRVQSGGMNAAAKPLFAFGMVYATTAAGGYQLFAVKPTGSGVVSDSAVAWKFSRNVPSRSSPILVGDLLYMVGDGGVFSCVDAHTGELVWQHRVEGKYSASPILADGRLYFFDEDGKCPVLEPAREFKELAVNSLGDGCMASPAAVGKSLFVRTKSALYRIEN